MNDSGAAAMWNMMSLLFKAHPWHGVSIGRKAPELLTAYIEIVPDDEVKFEVDKQSGYLRIDRPQKYSNVCPTLYGLIPQTFCGDGVAELSAERAGRPGIVGDGDPLDICVLTEKVISHGDVLVQAVPIGGLRMIDDDEADDKIIAVMEGDMIYGGLQDISQCPAPVLDRIMHYFLTYKQPPEGGGTPEVDIPAVYGAVEAREVIARAQRDYTDRFAAAQRLLETAMRSHG
jgi:inorganic pyrophosphatase